MWLQTRMFGNCLHVTWEGLTAWWGYVLVPGSVHRRAAQLCETTLQSMWLHNVLRTLLSPLSIFIQLFIRYVKYLELICISIFICHAKAFIFFPSLQNQQHLILLPFVSQYGLFAFPQALVTFWKDKQTTKALLARWSCTLLCCVKLFGFFL